MLRDYESLFEDMLDCCDRIIEYTAGLDSDSFFSDRKTIDAVIRNFEVIGEAARQLPQGYREQIAGIEWKEVIGMRNRMIHDYFGVDLDSFGTQLMKIFRILGRNWNHFCRRIRVSIRLTKTVLHSLATLDPMKLRFYIDTSVFGG